MDTQTQYKTRPSTRSSHKQTVVLFGELLADIFPDRAVLGGAPFNVAWHLKAFAQNPVLVTRLGNDALCEKALRAMLRNRMETVGVQYDKLHPTGQVQVQITEGVNRFNILPLQAYDFIHASVVRMITLSTHPEMVYFGTMAQRHDTSRHALKTLLRSTRAARFLDVNLRPPWYDEKILRQSIQFADIVKLNADELGELTEMLELPGSNPQAHAQALINQFDLRQVVITCGAEGAWQINRDGKRIDAGAKTHVANLVDTVGAGDGFASVCILGSLRRWPAAMTLARANSFAAAICGIRGAVPDQPDFYAPFIAEWGL